MHPVFGFLTDYREKGNKMSCSVIVARDFIRMDGSICSREDAEFAIKALTAACELTFPKYEKHVLVMLYCGVKKIDVIKEIRAIKNCTLTEAKDMAETPGAMIYEGTQEDCTRHAAMLRRFGADVDVRVAK